MITSSAVRSPSVPLRIRLGRQPVMVAMRIQPNSPSRPPRLNAELMTPTPMPDFPPRNLAARTTDGANTSAIPAPTMNLRIVTSGRLVLMEMVRTASDEMSMPIVTVFLGPCLAASMPPGICIVPTPR